MMLALFFLILAVLAAIVVVAPFLFKSGSSPTIDAGVNVYKDQLAEIERDLEQGAISKEEADLARVEIERRILSAAKTGEHEAGALGANWHYRIATGVAAIVVLGAAGIYATINHADRFYAQQSQQETTATNQQQQLDNVETMVKRLEERLAANPEDGNGWRVLGWTYYNLGQYAKSIEAYQRASNLQKDNPEIRALLGEAMVKAAGDRVTDEALAIFEEVLALNPNNERAHFFKGLAQEQKGNPQAAIDEWIALYKGAPEDAEWTGDLRQRIEGLAKEHNIDIATRLASLDKPDSPPQQAGGSQQRGPSAEDVQNAQQMAPEDRQAMVRNMVEGLSARLESAPDDAQGWIMLIRSHVTLNELDEARTALERAAKALADSPETLKQIADAAKVMGVSVRSE